MVLSIEQVIGYHFSDVVKKCMPQIEQDLQNMLKTGAIPPRFHPILVQNPPLVHSEDECFDISELLESLETAKDGMVFMDVGAGDGRWIWHALQWGEQLNGISQVVGVEGDPVHFKRMCDNLSAEGIPASQYTLIEKALVGSNKKEVYFESGSHDVWFGQAVSKAQQNLPLFSQQDLGWWFGLPFRACKYVTQPAIFYTKVKEMLSKPAGGVSISPKLTDKTQKSVVEYSTIKVSAIKLSTILKDYPLVHHVMMDIQGQEGEVIQECIKTANTKVRKFVIGTHSKAIDKQLPKIFRQHGWECVWAFPCNQTSQTPAGEIFFQDGVQVWKNPRIP